jgi:V8-like Glu-specific endopeptidase
MERFAELLFVSLVLVSLWACGGSGQKQTTEKNTDLMSLEQPASPYWSVANTGQLGQNENRSHVGPIVIPPQVTVHEDDKSFGFVPDGSVRIDDDTLEFAPNVKQETILKAICRKLPWQPRRASATPERYIVSLIMRVEGTTAVYSGTGVLISPRCILTAGHNVHYRGYPSRGWVSRIEVFAGREGGSCKVASISTNFRTIAAWINGDQRQNDHDIGAIILPDDKIYQWARGHFGVDPSGSTEKVCLLGYPWNKKDDDLRGQQYLSKGPAKRKGNVLEYDMDSYAGQSGGALYPEPSLSLIGIHVGGNCPNQSVLINDQLMERIKEWTEL